MPSRKPKRRRSRSRPGTKDDCLRQCVARVMDLPWQKVPHFVHKHGKLWRYYFSEWLRRKGWACVFAQNTPKSRTWLGGNASKWIAIGRTRDGSYHAVVRSRRRIEYDGGIPIVADTDLIALWRNPA